MPNQNPEQIARDEIDDRLTMAGWIVQSTKTIDFNKGVGIAVRLEHEEAERERSWSESGILECVRVASCEESAWQAAF